MFEDGHLPTMPATVEAEVSPDVPCTDDEQTRRVEGEIGDILFVMANIARRWKINPEEALRRSNRKFERRFQFIERELAAQGRTLQDATLLEMEEIYQNGKRQERE